MSRALVLVWLGALPVQPTQQADLESWARSRIVTLVPAFQPVRPSEHDDAFVDHWERLLSEADTAVEAGDASAAGRIALAEQELLAHPELPQAAFLRAELIRVEAELHRPSDPARAAALEDFAESLEGVRAQSYRSDEEPSPPLVQPSGAPGESISSIRGVRSGDDVYIDGVLGRPARMPSAHEHHVRVLRGGFPVYAGWVRADEATGVTELPRFALLPCSVPDLDRVRLERDGLSVPPGIACPDWIVARPRTTGGVEVSRCRKSSCGPLLPWSAPYGSNFNGIAQPQRDRAGFPGWIVWSLAGAALVTAGGVVAWQAGAFDEPQARQPGFSFTGPDAP